MTRAKRVGAGPDMPGAEGPSVSDRRLNCWEHTGCGREPGGRRVAELGVCLASVDSRLDGIHGGKNAGRCCWVVAGTFCEGQVQGTFAQKHPSCERCDFYKRVQEEEGPGAKQTNMLLSYLSSSEAADRRRYQQLLSSVIDSSVLPLARDDLEAVQRGEEKHITAFFSDIASSSVISAKLSCSELAAFLNEYFSAMTAVLKAEGGTVDKYVGDGMVGIFGAPVALGNHARASARAALGMIERLGELRDDWRRREAWCAEAWSLRMRIGLSSGRAKVGFFGTHDLASYTMIGPTVNAAKRLEEACEGYGVSILVSDATRDLIADEMVLRRLGRSRIKGRAVPEVVYELLGEKGRVSARQVRAAKVFEAALDMFERRRWCDAAGLFREAAALRRGDPTTLRLWRRSQRHLAPQ